MAGEYRPLGGITSVKLSVAYDNEAILTSPQFQSEIPLLEELSTYEQRQQLHGFEKCSAHSLRLVTDIDYELDSVVSLGEQFGFVALVEFRSGKRTVVGWSDTIRNARPLRLVTSREVSGERAAARPYREWLFETQY